MKKIITMRRFFIGFLASLLLLPASGFANETANTTHLGGVTDFAQSAIPPVTTFTPEQPKVFFSKPKDSAQLSSESSRTDQEEQENTLTLTKEPVPDSSTAEPAKQEKPVVEKKPALPPAIPPGTSFTPEQVKAFFSKAKEKDHIILNFDNAALRDVINTMSSITGESFILSPGLDARITVYSAGKIPTSEALSVFEYILEVNKLALVKSGQFYKIVPGATAKQKPIEVQKGKESEAVPSKDRPITQIVQVEYVPAAEVSSVLQPMLSPFGSIIPNQRNNLLIINDTASNIKRLLIILKELDVDAFKNTRMGFFRPKFSDVKSLSMELKEVLSGLNLTQHGVAVVPIERINSLVVFSSSPSLLKTIEGWLKKLDEEVTTGQNIFIYPVQNVKAESIAEVLERLYETENGVTPKSRTTRRVPPRAKTSRRQKSEVPIVHSRIEIVAFEPTNSLVIFAPPGIYREMKETIKQLDAYPQEVLIEVIIAEVTLTKDEQFGIQWSALGSVQIEGDDYTGLASNISKSLSAPSLTAPVLGTAPGGLSYALYRPDKLLALLHALASRGKVNILSSPRLLVRDQEEASIEVGSDIPTATSSTASAETAVSTLTQNIEYKTVGIKLKIKPSINDEKTVVLDIEQEVSDQLPNVTVGQEGFSYPAFSTRKTKTSIIVPDKQAIVIGGIMKEKKDKNYQGVPFLSSIPILGNLFRYTVDQMTKTELIVLLIPHVITNRAEADIVTMEFLEKLKEVKDYLKERESQISIPPFGETNPVQVNEQ